MVVNILVVNMIDGMTFPNPSPFILNFCVAGDYAINRQTVLQKYNSNIYDKTAILWF